MQEVEGMDLPVEAPDFDASGVPAHVVLVTPEIPQNTGNIARLCAATGAWLHLVCPLGFALQSRHLKRAGLDYWPAVRMSVHADLDALLHSVGERPLHLFSKSGTRRYTEVALPEGSILVFGCETRGLPAALLEARSRQTRRIPMRGSVRSLNLSNSVAIVVYEALRQADWGGEEPAQSSEPVGKPNLSGS